MEEMKQSSIASAALRGALAGLAGGVALMLVEQAERRTILPTGSDTTSAAAQAVKAVADTHDMEMPRARAEAIGGGLQLGWCAALGALFGIAHSRLETPALLDGIALAALGYAAEMMPGGIMQRAGVPPTLKQPMEQAIVPVGSHLAFGVATAAVFEAMT